MSKIAAEKITPEMLSPILEIDAELDFVDITASLRKTLTSLSPFGIGNPEPLFLLSHVKPWHVNFMGREQKHLRWQIKQKETK